MIRNDKNRAGEEVASLDMSHGLTCRISKLARVGRPTALCMGPLVWSTTLLGSSARHPTAKLELAPHALPTRAAGGGCSGSAPRNYNASTKSRDRLHHQLSSRAIGDTRYLKGSSNLNEESTWYLVPASIKSHLKGFAERLAGEDEGDGQQ